MQKNLKYKTLEEAPLALRNNCHLPGNLYTVIKLSILDSNNSRWRWQDPFQTWLRIHEVRLHQADQTDKAENHTLFFMWIIRGAGFMFFSAIHAILFCKYLFTEFFQIFDENHFFRFLFTTKLYNSVVTKMFSWKGH